MATKTHITKQEEAQTERSVQLRATDPGSPVANQTWINTTSDLFKYYDGATTHTVGGSTSARFQAQAYCLSDGSGTEINCTVGVNAGLTRITLTATTYTTGQNSGTTNGNLEIYLNGVKIPRFVDSTLTPNSSYTEVSSTVIDLDDDYSADAVSIEILKV